MTNTRATDPEILEARLPLRLQSFSVRANSGGQGEHVGGNGIIREIEVLAPATAALLASRRTSGAPGLGGDSGKAGKDSLFREGRWQPWDGESCTLEPGDRVRIQTPGGGGYNPS